ncbi:MAG TPA: DUF6516 family protein [Alphaproteobacteria bacterium]|nr:DUF6516 family protein [Alphaproteobacteria bacterium]
MAEARKIARIRLVVGAGFAELVVWRLPKPIPGSPHAYKYRLAYVVRGVCRVRYDNERGKGDHHHVDGVESSYAFDGLERLLADFWRDVDERR